MDPMGYDSFGFLCFAMLLLLLYVVNSPVPIPRKDAMFRPANQFDTEPTANSSGNGSCKLGPSKSKGPKTHAGVAMVCVCEALNQQQSATTWWILYSRPFFPQEFDQISSNIINNHTKIGSFSQVAGALGLADSLRRFYVHRTWP
jgi:hypothetical protein